MQDIAEFLRGQDPFSGLDEGELDELAARTEIEFFPAGTTILPQGERPADRIRVIRRGAVQLLDHGQPMDLLGEGEMLGHPSALSGQPTRYEARATEDTLAYSLAAEDVVPLLGRPSSLRFLARSLLGRVQRVGAEDIGSPSAEVARQYASALIRREPLICPPETSLREAARLMSAGDHSSVLVALDGGEFGIVTDTDLRSQVVVGQLSPDDRVTAAMSTPLVTVGPDQTGADVMLAMLDHDIRHVPVIESGKVLGVIVAVDLVAAETRSPFVLRRAIGLARNKGELQDAASRLRSTIVALHRAELTPLHVSDVVSAVTDALIRRMIELDIEAQGPPPAEFAWMSLGSHGRREPVPSSDVDSGMAWRDRPDPDPIATEPRRRLASARIGDYMHAMAGSVADCVRVIGWRLDPHGVTASGPFSASSIEEWRASIESWLARPSENRVLIAVSILLDGRVVYGPERGLDVKPLLFEMGDRRSLETWMLRLALEAKPPTGFIRNIVVYASGRRHQALDIKHGGLLPVINLARYAALVGEIPANHTIDRLRAATARGVMKAAEARVLQEAFELFSALRLEHQVRQLEHDREPDDLVAPEELDPLTRRYLRDAFNEVAAVQRSYAAAARR
jgi:CBS domain-containing protein